MRFWCSHAVPEIDPQRYGLDENESQNFRGLLNNQIAAGTVKQAQQFLCDTYCESASAEFSHIESEAEREWLIENFEKRHATADVSVVEKREILELMLKSQAWDQFLATKFPTVKRYGGEGAESMMAFFHQLMLSAAECDVNDIVLGMNHRGKLNLLTTMLRCRPAKIFRKFKGLPEFPADAKAMGDIASHFREYFRGAAIYCGLIDASICFCTDVCEDFDVNGKKLHFTMLHNPSHLEAVNPVSMGKTFST